MSGKKQEMKGEKKEKRMDCCLVVHFKQLTAMKIPYGHTQIKKAMIPKSLYFQNIHSGKREKERDQDVRLPIILYFPKGHFETIKDR